MVYMWLIILYMGIIVFVNKIKCFEFLLYIMLWYYKYMYSVVCCLMERLLKFIFFLGKYDKVIKWVEVVG